MTKQDYINRFENFSAAVEWENQYLSIGREFLGQAALDLLDGAEPTESYWAELCQQVDIQAREESANV